MFKFIIASSNQGKIREFQSMLSDMGEVISQKEANIHIEPKESGETFEENALIKAKTIFNTLPKDSKNIFILADDSGICVDALDGAPGVKSARYASPTSHNASDSANRNKLISELKAKQIERSKAKFVACIALVGEGAHGERIEFSAIGECDGEVIAEERGKNGFGYDSMFIPEGFTQTLAEVAPEVKNALSHRHKALQKVREYLSVLE
ncbi:non-canonical purine NTP pyrophosphatase, RdgB/HAM1 family [Helicobacter sp. CLO-3]|uniref:RdgB/HAM1 family non-canonical purine NTP pyrophosphatase n=1 Tax=unclassified Helicobacter TaxID=2593540 RepID=UPI0008054D49|nr:MULTISPECIES: RdgB/HAM1 family non-canonical purine NTP pyrophosphatase [unclassified Helicobacter]OBV29764.1 non-canonical purine NTP pyrophosphatase, RdgB/HAM1 family [Helicobacter sp. CLO-3]OHU85217.1 non-canonical purine NTP pyrophosphatase, RdgB/HAM1 family [Helicobacter sp. CLO-3]